MSLLSDMLAALDRWTEWKQMRAAPGRLDELEKRVAELESTKKALPAPDACPKCGAEVKFQQEGQYRFQGIAMPGVMQRTLKCSGERCDYTTTKLVDPHGMLNKGRR